MSVLQVVTGKPVREPRRKRIPACPRCESDRETYSRGKLCESHRDLQGEMWEFVRQYKEERGCTDCGGAFPHYVLDLDHLPGREKVANISKAGTAKLGTWRALHLELAKCEVVCKNCHAVRGYERRKEI